ncbi:MAG: hypothetical protein HND58_15575 [Planctomycetota bacterium]|nr:MAG: hypothetical protein HND58_15575 [Planctomycetota bacterium]
MRIGEGTRQEFVCATVVVGDSDAGECDERRDARLAAAAEHFCDAGLDIETVR